MKIVFLALLLIILQYPVALSAQDIQFKILTNLPNDQNLYTGKANLIELKNLPANTKMTLLHGQIKKAGINSFFVYEPYRDIPSEDELTVSAGKEVIFKKTFPVVFSECAYFQLGSIETDTVKSEGTQGNQTRIRYPKSCGVSAYFSNSVLIDTVAIISKKFKYKISGFRLGMQNRGSDYTEAYSTTNRLSSIQIQMLTNLRMGGVLYINDVKWDCNGCKEFVNPISLQQRIVIE